MTEDGRKDEQKPDDGAGQRGCLKPLMRFLTKAERKFLKEAKLIQTTPSFGILLSEIVI